ncbi:MAG: MobC family plasmid mobilization relaxosome protein [Paracoccaceae bacterium]|nr:MobC family plasmid mobilization relaxosome protein [Paracoccaceae bacterium]
MTETAKPKREPLDVRITIRLPSRVREDWRQAAAKEDMNLADWLRSRVVVNDRKPTRRKPRPVHSRPRRIPYVTADPELLRELARIGNNINQIARRLNSRSDIPVFEVLRWLTFMNNVMNHLLETRDKGP